MEEELVEGKEEVLEVDGRGSSTTWWFFKRKRSLDQRARDVYGWGSEVGNMFLMDGSGYVKSVMGVSRYRWAAREK